MNDLVRVRYGGKTYVGHVKSVEAILGDGSGRDSTGKLIITSIVGYQVELFDDGSNAIMKLQVERFSDIDGIK